MSEATEALEHAEHAGDHASHGDEERGHGGGGFQSKAIGLTIAVLGVLLAICAALVGRGLLELVLRLRKVRRRLAELSVRADVRRHREQSKEMASEDEDVLKSFEQSFAPDTPAAPAPQGTGGEH
jgi:hypothetical protein